MRLGWLPVLLCGVLWSMPARPSEELQSLYSAGKFEEALHLITSHPSETAAYYYNLGSTHLKLGQSGLAVAYLEKAHRIQPHDPDIRNNLRIARDRLGQLLGDSRLDPASNWAEQVMDRVPLDEIRGAVGLLALLVTLFWARGYLKTRDLRVALLSPSGILTLMGFALAGGLYFAQRLADSEPPGAALQALVVRSGPGDRYFELGRLEAGTKIRLLGPSLEADDADGKKALWKQVRFSADAVGWVRAAGVLLL